MASQKEILKSFNDIIYKIGADPKRSISLFLLENFEGITKIGNNDINEYKKLKREIVNKYADYIKVHYNSNSDSDWFSDPETKIDFRSYVRKIEYDRDFFESINNNYLLEIIDNIKSKINSAEYITNKKEENKGCYIATMVYEDFNHPNVIQLRYFRDNTLNKTEIGKLFIKFYYIYSPNIAYRLKNKYYLNKIIKKILDKFVRKLKTKK